MLKEKMSVKTKLPRFESLYDSIIPGVPGIMLSETAVILRAPLLKHEDCSDGEIFKLMSITDIPDFGYAATPRKEIRVSRAIKKAEKYLLKPYDVILSIVGTIGKLCIVPDSIEGKWVPMSNVLVIRFTQQKQDSAIAFCAFMNSPVGKNIQKMLTHDTKIPMISKKEFSRIPVPQLTSDVKRWSRSVFLQEKKLVAKINNTIEKINATRAEYLLQEDLQTALNDTLQTVDV